MPSDPIVYIDRSRIRPGRIGDLRKAIDRLVRFIEHREPQLLHYGFYLDEEQSRMTVVAMHPDPASVERHMEIGGPAFRGFADLIEMEGIEIYGVPSERMLEQLHQKAEMRGEDCRVVVGTLHEGFSRLSPATV